MQNHHRAWQCQICSDQFGTADHLESHVKRMHADALDSSQLETFVETCSRPLDSSSANDCDFCDWASRLSALPKDAGHKAKADLTVPTARFLKHLARHMEQAALFSLPRIAFSDVDSAVAGMGEDESNGAEQALVRCNIFTCAYFHDAKTHID